MLTNDQKKKKKYHLSIWYCSIDVGMTHPTNRNLKTKYKQIKFS